jgi:TetR/AcrR family transcriptional repressor of nem operon
MPLRLVKRLVLTEFTCLVDTMAQEVYASSPAIRYACASSIFGRPHREKALS